MAKKTRMMRRKKVVRKTKKSGGARSPPPPPSPEKVERNAQMAALEEFIGSITTTPPSPPKSPSSRSSISSGSTGSSPYSSSPSSPSLRRGLPPTATLRQQVLNNSLAIDECIGEHSCRPKGGKLRKCYEKDNTKRNSNGKRVLRLPSNRLGVCLTEEEAQSQ